MFINNRKTTSAAHQFSWWFADFIYEEIIKNKKIYITDHCDKIDFDDTKFILNKSGSGFKDTLSYWCEAVIMGRAPVVILDFDILDGLEEMTKAEIEFQRKDNKRVIETVDQKEIVIKILKNELSLRDQEKMIQATEIPDADNKIFNKYIKKLSKTSKNPKIKEAIKNYFCVLEKYHYSAFQAAAALFKIALLVKKLKFRKNKVKENIVSAKIIDYIKSEHSKKRKEETANSIFLLIRTIASAVPGQINNEPGICKIDISNFSTIMKIAMGEEDFNHYSSTKEQKMIEAILPENSKTKAAHKI